ncbi:MAG: undecaprenyl-phosphate galactose phosphotransferase WbaP [Candidatus Riflebacteria bacterium]
MEKIRRFRDFVILAGLDGFSLLCSYYLTMAVHALAMSVGLARNNPFVPGENLLHLLPIFFFFIGISGLYTRRRPFWDEARELTKAISTALVVVLMILYFAKISWHFSVYRTFVFFFFAAFLVPICRYWGKLTLYHIGIWREPLLILGAGQSARAVASALLGDPYLGYQVVGFLDDDEKLIGQKLPIRNSYVKVYGHIRHFRKFVSKLRLSNIIIAVPTMGMSALTRLTTRVQKYCRNVILIPDLKGIALLNTELHHLFDEQLFLLRINNNLLSAFNRMLKRLFDLIVAIALLPILLPMISLIALAIRLETGNAAFFVQGRLGRNKKNFKCIKFQTMFPNADAMLDDYFKKYPDRREEWVKFKKIKGDDPRVTRIGRILRATSLDELPQIFNVLAGSMSLVGPRPYLPREEEDMKEYIETILLTTPGITGLWQVRGRNELDFDTRLQLDNWYVLNWSMWADIEILFKTVRVVFFRKGAF